MAKKKIEEVSVEVKQEQDMLDLTGVIKAEMDDAKDFIHQVGEERAESTEYYLGNELLQAVLSLYSKTENASKTSYYP